MLARSLRCMKTLSSAALVFTLLSAAAAWGAGGRMPTENKSLRLADGREIFLDRRGDHSHDVMLLGADRILWSRVFEQEYDRLWDYAFFVPVKKGGHYSYDMNGDGYPEIAIATWDGGINMRGRTALVFTVLPDSLAYFATEPFNLEYGEYVYR